MKRLSLFACVLMVFLAGCQEPLETSSSPTPSPPPGRVDGCIRDACLVKPGLAENRPAESYGFRRILAAGETLYPAIHGDLAAWSMYAEEDGNRAAWLLGYDIAADRLVDIDSPPGVDRNGAIFYKGELWYPYIPIGGEPKIAVWNGTTGIRQYYELEGFNGTQYLSGVGHDDRWLLVLNFDAPTLEEEGEFAYNLETKKKVKVYSPPPEGAPEAGRVKNRGTAVFGDVAFNVYTNALETNSRMMEINLTTGASREVWRLGKQVNVIARAEHHVILEVAIRSDGTTSLFVYNVTSRRMQQYDTIEDINDITAAGDWVVFDYQNGLAAFHLPTEQLKILIPRRGGFGVHAAATDGHSVLVAMENAQGLMINPYWGRLPAP